MRQNINLIISNMGWYVFKPYFTFKLWWPFCYVGSKIVSMIRKYHNHKPQTTPWYREEELLNRHKTPGRQIKQSNQPSLSLPHQDDYNTRMDIKQRTTKHRTITDQGWSTHTRTCTRTYSSTFFAVLSCTLYVAKFMSTCTRTYLSTVTKNPVLKSTLRVLLSTFLSFNQIGKKS